MFKEEHKKKYRKQLKEAILIKYGKFEQQSK